MVIVVREAVQNDIYSIQRLLEALTQNGNVDVIEEQINFFLNTNNNFLLVADLNNSVVGTVQLNICPDAMYNQQPYALIENVVVDKASEKQGIGKALLHKVEEICAIHNCSKMMLLSSNLRVEAHHFFEQSGFSGSTKKGFIKYSASFKVKTT